jgi:hypothetical protein
MSDLQAIADRVEIEGREEIRAGVERLQSLLECFVQTTHPGTIRLEGDTTPLAGSAPQPAGGSR